MAEVTRQRTGMFLRFIFGLLMDKPDGMQAKDILATVPNSISLTEYEKGYYSGDPNTQRYQKIIRFATIDVVKAGRLAKSKGRWYITDEGKQAYNKYTDPEVFYREAVRLYQEWKRSRPQGDDVDMPGVEPTPKAAVTVEEAEELAWDQIQQFLALKQADVGIAMGITGTEVAKEAADAILTDDNFATIEAAVEEGRGVFDNLTKFISWTLPTNLGEGLIILLALLLGVALPILPIQILWINMISVAVLGTVLALESKELNIMRRPPRHPDAPILTRELLWRIVLVGGLILIGAFGLFEWELQSGNSLTQARTVAVSVVVLIGIAYLLNCRSLTQSMFRIGRIDHLFEVGILLEFYRGRLCPNQ